MTKTEAIKRYGLAVVEKAREIYETDFGKVLFADDADYEDIPADEETQLDRIGMAIVALGITQKTILDHFNDLRSEILRYTPSGSPHWSTVDAFYEFEIHLKNYCHEHDSIPKTC
jgi:hypothetical protein